MAAVSGEISNVHRVCKQIRTHVVRKECLGLCLQCSQWDLNGLRSLEVHGADNPGSVCVQLSQSVGVQHLKGRSLPRVVGILQEKAEVKGLEAKAKDIDE